MCFPSADVMNYRGDKLEGGFGNYWTLPGGGRKQIDAGMQADLMRNWLTGGGLPKAPDPTTTLAQSKALQPIYQQAALGQGFTGLFKLPKPQAPMSGGVPYSVPPISPIGGK